MRIMTRYKFFVGSLPIEVDAHNEEDALNLAVSYSNEYCGAAKISERN